MKYTFNRREFEDNRIKTYYDTNVEFGNERLSVLHKELYNGIKDKLGIRNDASATMAVLSDGHTYSIMFLEIISLPYIEYLPKTVIRRNKAETPPNKNPAEKKDSSVYLSDFGLDVSGRMTK